MTKTLLRLMKIFLALLVLLFSSSISSQELKGLVVDAKTGYEIPFASVRLSSTSLQTTAGTNGAFHLIYKRWKPNDSLLVTSSGYWPIKVAIDSGVSEYRVSLIQNEKDTSWKELVVLPVNINFTQLCIKRHLDSIVNYRTTRTIPIFLLDPCYDWNKKCWDSFHDTESFRWKLISRVKDKKLLQMLLQDGGDRFKTKCTLKRTYKSYPGSLTPKLITVSTFELVRKRIRQLH